MKNMMHVVLLVSLAVILFPTAGATQEQIRPQIRNRA